MKVLLINGSPHREGCTYTALCEVSRALNDNGVDTDIFWIGNKALSGCIACKKCQGTGKCVFQDSVNEFLEIAGSEWRQQPLPAETGSGRDLGQKSWNHSNLGPDE